MSDDKELLPPFSGDMGATNLIEQWRRQREQQTMAAQASSIVQARTSRTVQMRGEKVAATRSYVDIGAVQTGGVDIGAAQSRAPEVAIGFALLDFGGRVAEGDVIVAVTPVWIRIISELERDPKAFYRLDSRQFEELVAGGWRAHDWQVTLTPRSADGGVDIIASRADFGAIRILDQVKLYAPDRLVRAHDVRAMWGVLEADRRASKAYVTTTSDFAPGVADEFADRMPTRIELRNGAALATWLAQAIKH